LAESDIQLPVFALQQLAFMTPELEFCYARTTASSAQLTHWFANTGTWRHIHVAHMEFGQISEYKSSSMTSWKQVLSMHPRLVMVPDFILPHLRDSLEDELLTQPPVVRHLASPRLAERVTPALKRLEVLSWTCLPPCASLLNVASACPNLRVLDLHRLGHLDRDAFLALQPLGLVRLQLTFNTTNVVMDDIIQFTERTSTLQRLLVCGTTPLVIGHTNRFSAWLAGKKNEVVTWLTGENTKALGAVFDRRDNPPFRVLYHEMVHPHLLWCWWKDEFMDNPFGWYSER
jgi:hypothetical protein